MSHFVESEHLDVPTLSALRLSCKKLRGVADSNKLWSKVPYILESGKINMPCFTMLKLKCAGTEGVCVETVCKATQTHYALKKARPFPEVSYSARLSSTARDITGMDPIDLLIERRSAVLHDTRDCYPEGR